LKVYKIVDFKLYILISYPQFCGLLNIYVDKLKYTKVH